MLLWKLSSSVNALGVKADQYGSLLIPIIMAKLPPEIRVHVAQNTTQEVWNIESILNAIQSDKVKAMTSTKAWKFDYKFLSSRFSATLPNTKCVYCSERHFSASYKIVPDCNSRKSILKRDKWKVMQKVL